MEVFFHNLIKEIEASENYLKENHSNLPVTSRVARLLNLDNYQSRILCYVFYLKIVKSGDFDNEELKRLVDIRDRQYLCFVRAIEELYVKGYLFFTEKSYRMGRSEGFFDSRVSVSGVVFNFFINGELPDDDRETIETPDDLGEYVVDVFESVNDLNASREKTLNYLELKLSEIYKRLSDKFPLVDTVKKLSVFEIVVLGLLLHGFSEKRRLSIPFRNLMMTRVGQVLRSALIVGDRFEKSMLSKSGLVSVFESDRMKGKEFVLTEKSLKGFFNVRVESLIALSMLDKVKSVKKKELFFSKDIEEEVKQVEEIVSRRNYKKFCSLSRKKKLKPSITVLLYGMPGTGKTEFVYQVARKTKRRVLKLDIAKCISKWVGDSEKNIREVFEEYRKSLDLYPGHPILLLNEADVFLSERIAVRDSVDQTYNDLRNIFLEEMENFEGILFATTNLIDNLDAAFFRRFGFKIRFNLPDRETRAKIWKSKLPDLGDYYVNLLSEFPLSGGDIDNVVKKLLVASVVNSQLKEEEVLIKLARDEAEFKGYTEGYNKLGFKVV